jgi:hypothetical protein
LHLSDVDNPKNFETLPRVYPFARLQVFKIENTSEKYKE